MLKLKQTSATFNKYWYVNADGCHTGLSPFGEANNYLCIDEVKDLADDDDTYVYSNATDLQYDMYELTNDPIPATATINYIQVFAKAKSHEYAPSSDATYYILISDNDCSDIYTSDNKELITSYSTYNYLWTENPRTTTDWVVADLNNLQIGIECSSPTYGAKGLNVTFRPNAIGTYSELVAYGDAPNYKCVDEVIKDSNTYVVLYSTSYFKDTYGIDTMSTSGTINSITVFAWVGISWHTGHIPKDLGYSKITIISGGNLYYGTEERMDMGWKLISYTWTVNPDDSATWDWSDIDNLEIGISLKAPNASYEADCTQVYMVLNYDEQINPDIRTTQCYAKVNYTTDSECTLQNPNEIEMNQSQIVNKINFWDGSREVYGIARGNKTMLLSGYEWDDEVAGIDADDRIACVRAMGKAIGEILVTVEGSGSKEWDGEYRLISFNWKKMHDSPKSYEWMLELEDTE